MDYKKLTKEEIRSIVKPIVVVAEERGVSLDKVWDTSSNRERAVWLVVTGVDDEDIINKFCAYNWNYVSANLRQKMEEFLPKPLKDVAVSEECRATIEAAFELISERCGVAVSKEYRATLQAALKSMRKLDTDLEKKTEQGIDADNNKKELVVPQLPDFRQFARLAREEEKEKKKEERLADAEQELENKFLEQLPED